MVQTVLGVQQEATSAQRALQALPAVVGFLRTNQACTTASRTAGARWRVSALLERRPAGCRTGGG